MNIKGFSSLAMRILQVLGSLLVGLWLPTELFLFGSARTGVTVPSLERFLSVILLSFVFHTIFLYLSALMSFSLSYENSLFDWLHVPLLLAAATLLALYQTFCFFKARKFRVGFLCVIPFLVLLLTPLWMIAERAVIYTLYLQNRDHWLERVNAIPSSEGVLKFVRLNENLIEHNVQRSFVYDESDELANKHGLHLRYWLNDSVSKPHQMKMSKLNVYNISNHFYLVDEHFESSGYQLIITERGYEILQGSCRDIVEPVREGCSDHWK